MTGDRRRRPRALLSHEPPLGGIHPSWLPSAQLAQSFEFLPQIDPFEPRSIPGCQVHAWEIDIRLGHLVCSCQPQIALVMSGGYKSSWLALKNQEDDR